MGAPKDIDILAIFDLEQVSKLTYIGPSFDFVGKRIFGGQVLAQALYAAGQTSDVLANSMHAYFLLPGDVSEPVRYEVEILRQGKSVGSRQVKAYQKDELIFIATISFAIEEDGMFYQPAAPRYPDPEKLPTEHEVKSQYLEYVPESFKERYMRARPIDFRFIDSVNPFIPRITTPAKRAHWMRVPQLLKDDPLLHQALLAFASDYVLLTTALLPHGVSMMDPRLQAASLDHTIYFHELLKMDSWLLYEMMATKTFAGRGLNYGQIWQNGQLVASIVQEGLMRIRAPKQTTV